MAFGRKIFSRFLPAAKNFHSPAITEIPAAPSQIHAVHIFQCPIEMDFVIRTWWGSSPSSLNALPCAAPAFTASMSSSPRTNSEFVFDPARWPRDVMENDFMDIGKLFKSERSVVRVPDLDPKYKIAILASKQDHCLVDVLHGWQDGRLPVDIICVISNHDRAPNTHVIRFLQRHGIPYYYMPTTSGNKREEEIFNLVNDTDFLVLARYMQVLSARFLEGYGKDIINIHHGLLPSFKGSNPAKQAYMAGVKLIGATTHFVTPELDAGPIIEQMVERVSHRDTLDSFVQKSENLEKQCLRKAIKSYCELRVLPYEGKKTVVF